MTITQRGSIYRHRANVELINTRGHATVQRRVSVDAQWPSHQIEITVTGQRLPRLLGTDENMINQNMGTLGIELQTSKRHCPSQVDFTALRNATSEQRQQLTEIQVTRVDTNPQENGSLGYIVATQLVISQLASPLFPLAYQYSIPSCSFPFLYRMVHLH